MVETRQAPAEASQKRKAAGRAAFRNRSPESYAVSMVLRWRRAA
jgi:hypothetical protein